MAELSTIYSDIDNIDAENITQEDLIAQIADALDGKGTPGGGSNYPSIKVFSGWGRELESAIGKTAHLISLPKIGIMSDATVTAEAN